MKEQREIERKFLVIGEEWREEADKESKQVIDQVYVVNTSEVTIRIRSRITYPRESIIDERASITIKSPREGLVRNEIDLKMDHTTALHLIAELKDNYPSIQKVRHFVKINDHLRWEIDCFVNKDLQDLIIAEVELPFEDYPDFVKPCWIGEEVTNDPLFSNAILAERGKFDRPKRISDDIQRNFKESWAFLLKGDGSVNLDLLKCELMDFSFLIDQIPKVYNHIAGLSKHMYPAELITSLADERYWDMHRNIILDDIRDCGFTTVQEVIDYLDPKSG